MQHSIHTTKEHYLTYFGCGLLVTLGTGFFFSALFGFAPIEPADDRIYFLAFSAFVTLLSGAFLYYMMRIPTMMTCADERLTLTSPVRRIDLQHADIIELDETDSEPMLRTKNKSIQLYKYYNDFDTFRSWVTSYRA